MFKDPAFSQGPHEHGSLADMSKRGLHWVDQPRKVWSIGFWIGKKQHLVLNIKWQILFLLFLTSSDGSQNPTPIVNMLLPLGLFIAELQSPIQLAAETLRRIRQKATEVLAGEVMGFGLLVVGCFLWFLFLLFLLFFVFLLFLLFLLSFFFSSCFCCSSCSCGFWKYSLCWYKSSWQRRWVKFCFFFWQRFLKL